jgi:DNA repair photolyase
LRQSWHQVKLASKKSAKKDGENLNMEKAVISPLDYPCYPKGWEIDLMQGCDIGCIYCSLSDNEKIGPVNIDNILGTSISPNGIYLSPKSDPFSELAKENTHRVLEKFLPEGTGVELITKKKIPEKTIKLISQYPNQVVPNITLCRIDQELNNYIEKNAATTRERLDTIKDLSEAGMNVIVRMTPVFPIIDDGYETLEDFVCQISEAGAFQVKVAYAVIRDALAFRSIINKMIMHPRLKQAWDVMTDTIEIYKGKGNVPPLDRRVQLYRNLFELTKRYGLKFGVCSILDLPMLEMKEEDLGFPLCRSVLLNMESKIDTNLQLSEST